jgi:hypothetical protein
MDTNEKQPDKCSCRGGRLTKNLYECLSGHTACQYRYSFGNVCYCSTLPVDRSDQRASNFSLNWEDSHGQYDR